MSGSLMHTCSWCGQRIATTPAGGFGENGGLAATSEERMHQASTVVEMEIDETIPLDKDVATGLATAHTELHLRYQPTRPAFIYRHTPGGSVGGDSPFTGRFRVPHAWTELESTCQEILVSKYWRTAAFGARCRSPYGSEVCIR